MWCPTNSFILHSYEKSTLISRYLISTRCVQSSLTPGNVVDVLLQCWVLVNVEKSKNCPKNRCLQFIQGKVNVNNFECD